MKVKMVDVARYLGVSKATVSLAVHDKPGVNPETRRKVLECIEQMQKNGGALPETSASVSATVNQMIKVVIINHRKKVVCDPELDLWSEVLATFDTEARKRSYFYGLTYMNDSDEEREAVLAECNMDIVSGIVVFATEMTAEDEKLLQKINKPIVLYDCESEDGAYSSVCIDNAGAVNKALKLLYGAGASRVKYLCTGKDIYNFRKRREAFYSSMIGREELPARDDVVELGETIPTITENFLAWLDSHKMPDAFLFENYQISIGVMTALRRRGIRVPQQVSVVGIDEIPEMILTDISLTQIKIPHAERAAMAMDLLEKEMSDFWKCKIKVFTEPEVILRDSI